MIDLTQNLMKKHPDGPLFRNRHGKPWTRQALTARFRVLSRRLELKGLSAYTYRHTAISDALIRGVPIAVVAELFGTSIQTISCSYFYCATFCLGLPGARGNGFGRRGGSFPVTLQPRACKSFCVRRGWNEDCNSLFRRAGHPVRTPHGQGRHRRRPTPTGPRPSRRGRGNRQVPQRPRRLGLGILLPGPRGLPHHAGDRRDPGRRGAGVPERRRDRAPHDARRPRHPPRLHARRLVLSPQLRERVPLLLRCPHRRRLVDRRPVARPRLVVLVRHVRQSRPHQGHQAEGGGLPQEWWTPR